MTILKKSFDSSARVTNSEGTWTNSDESERYFNALTGRTFQSGDGTTYY
jgi:hypothetical protein